CIQCPAKFLRLVERVNSRRIRGSRVHHLACIRRRADQNIASGRHRQRTRWIILVGYGWDCSSGCKCKSGSKRECRDQISSFHLLISTLMDVCAPCPDQAVMSTTIWKYSGEL